MKEELGKNVAERLAEAVVRNVCELPGYTSPDDQPELVMCTVDELNACVVRAIESQPSFVWQRYYVNDGSGNWSAPSKKLDEVINTLRQALKPFAAMDRPNCDLNEIACHRGVASDMTILTSADFRRAAEALELTEIPVGAVRAKGDQGEQETI